MTTQEKEKVANAIEEAITQGFLRSLGTTTAQLIANSIDDAKRSLDQFVVNNTDEISDGYHTFGQLYYQRAVLFATIVNLFPERAWKTLRHADGNYCFDSDGEMFLVSIDTPEGQYSYHYEKALWDMFKCKEVLKAPYFDGHTETDVTRLLSLVSVDKED